jgi:hypothetical protein
MQRKIKMGGQEISCRLSILRERRSRASNGGLRYVAQGFRNAAASDRPLMPVATTMVFKLLARLMASSRELPAICLLDFEFALRAAEWAVTSFTPHCDSGHKTMSHQAHAACPLDPVPQAVKAQKVHTARRMR